VSPIGFSSKIPHQQKMVGIYPLIKLVTRTAMKPNLVNMTKFLESGFVSRDILSPEFIAYYHATVSGSPTSQPLLFMNSLTRGLKLKPSAVVAGELSALQTPTLVVVGEQDKNIPTQEIYEIAKRLRNGRTVRFRQSAHIPSIDQSDEFNATVIKFLQEDPTA
jgi:pimeloyl-ACP methyl ester carboxylesterase